MLLAEASIQQESQSLSHGWSGLRKFRVVSKTTECQDICTFELSPHDKQAIPNYKPGQHITVSLQPHNQKRIVRCYSLSDCFKSKNNYTITVKHLSENGNKPAGKSSSLLHRDIQEGDLIDIKAPKGRFYLNLKSQQPVVLMANGVGITPLLAMLNYLSEHQAERKVYLFYGARNSRYVIQASHLRETVEKHPSFSLVLAYSQPLKTDVLGQDYDVEGYINSQLVIKHLSNLPSYMRLSHTEKPEFYICGTAAMMQENIAGLKQWDVPDKVINHEAFGAASIQKSQSQRKNNSTFAITFKQSDQTHEWNGEHNSLLEMSQNKSIPIDSGCCCGECGTCEVAILSGSVTYPNGKPETEVAEGHCLMCIAAPTSPLTLDA